MNASISAGGVSGGHAKANVCAAIWLMRRQSSFTASRTEKGIDDSFVEKAQVIRYVFLYIAITYKKDTAMTRPSPLPYENL